MKQLKRLFNDWVLVKLDPISSENVSSGGILLTSPALVRTGTVLQVGPGKDYSDGVHRKIEAQNGDRVAFFTGNMDTKQGEAIKLHIGDEQALIPESAVLFFFELGEGEALPRIDR